MSWDQGEQKWRGSCTELCDSVVLDTMVPTVVIIDVLKR